MKMSEVFKLPSWVGKFGDGHRGYHVCNGQMSNALFADKCTKGEAEAICEAINSHDTKLADIDRLLDRLESFIDPTKMGSTELAEASYFAHQTYTELREKHPKE